jgi:hypothetical protein
LTHDIFISHSSATKELARQIFYNSVSNGLSVWYDEALLATGQMLENELRAGIEGSRAFLLLYSKAVMEKQWVPLEMSIAETIVKRGDPLKLIVVKLDDHPLPEFWEQFIYLGWNNLDQSGALLRLLSKLTGRQPFTPIAAAAVLSKVPSELFVNQSNTVAEHSRNYVLFYLAHVKQLLSAVASVGHERELRDTIEKLLQVSLFAQLPATTAD